MDDDVHPEPVVLRLLRRLVFLGGLLVGFFVAGLLLAGPAQAASGGSDSSGGGSASGTTSAVVHAVVSKASGTTTSARTAATKPSSAKPTSAKPTSAKPTSAKATTARTTSAKPTSAKPTSAKPTSAKPTSAKPTSAKATSGTTTSVTAGSGAATVRRLADTATGAARPLPPVADPVARLVVHDAVVPQPSTTLREVTSAVVSPSPAATVASVAPRASALPIPLGAATTSTPGLPSVLGPVATVTSTVLDRDVSGSSRVTRRAVPAGSGRCRPARAHPALRGDQPDRRPPRPHGHRADPDHEWAHGRGRHARRDRPRCIARRARRAVRGGRDPRDTQRGPRRRRSSPS